MDNGRDVKTRKDYQRRCNQDASNVENKRKRRECTLQSPIDPANLRKRLEEISGRNVRTNTIEGILLFTDWASRQDDVFEVHRDFGRDYLSRFCGMDIMPLLCRLGLARKMANHSDKAHIATRYTFTIRCQKYRIALSKTTQSKIQTAQSRKKRRLRKTNPSRAWVEDSLSRTKLPDTEVIRLMAIKGHPHKHTLKALESGGWVKTKRGRITTPISNLPPESRERLLMDMQSVTRLDLSSSHVLMLVKYLSDLTDISSNQTSKAARFAEINSLRVFLSSGDFYRKILPDQNRSKAKLSVQKFLNQVGSGKHDRNVAAAFRQHFPYTVRILLNHRGPIGPALQKLENNLIRNALIRLHEFHISAIPVVDEIIVPLSHREVALRVLSTETYSLTGVIPTISGTRTNNLEIT